MTAESVQFPEGFLWGVATSSFQIEGDAAGRGESIWDRFCRKPGAVHAGDTGDVACDHVRRFKEDVQLLRALSLNSYRFSIAWPRVLPQGRGAVNHKGLDFYDRLVDSLLEAGIAPMITLYHWDLPQALQDLGGWESGDTGSWFADYTAVVVNRLKDRVKFWTTLNEPWVSAFLGYQKGEHAPGVRDGRRALQVAHNLMVAHGKAMQVIRAQAPAALAGIVLSLWPAEPYSQAQADLEAAEFDWQKELGWFLSPLLNGYYPPYVLESYGKAAPEIKPGDMALIAQPMDILGVNYYSRTVMSAQGKVSPVPGSRYTDMGWEVCAPALRRLLIKMKADYRLPPLYITENGCAVEDAPGPDGSINDWERLEFLHDHLAECHHAIADGVDLRGYYAWSLLDNFEWAYGYSKRFGLVHVDFQTQKRTLKESGRWYAQVASTGRLLPVAKTSPAPAAGR